MPVFLMLRLLLTALLPLALAVAPAGWARAAGQPAAPADTARTYWLDRDNTPLLREFRQQPPANERSVAQWQAQVQAHPTPDLARLVLLDRLAAAQQARDVQAAYPVYLAARRLAFRLPYPQARAETLLMLADHHTELAQYDSAAAYLRAAEHQFRLGRDRGGVVRCLTRLGRTADLQGRYAASLAYNQQAMALATTGNTRRFRTTARIQLGTTYTQVGDYAEALRHLRVALHVARYHDYPDRINLALGEIGEVYRRQQRWQQARTYFDSSVSVSRRINDEPQVLAMQLKLAQLREAQGQLPAAAAEGRQVLARLQAANLRLLVPLAQALLARVALAQGQGPAALAYGRQSLAGSQQARLLRGVAEAQAVLAEAYTRQHRYAAALLALRGYTAAHDSLLGAEARRRTAVLQASQRQREQQTQIRLLTQQNRLQAERQQIARLQSQRTVLGLSALALLAVLLAGLGLGYYRRRQQQREAALRQQLAADLHDDVGTLLSQIALQSELLQTGLPDTVGQARKLNQIAEASRNARRQLNDVVWSLDAHNDTLPDLLDRLRDHAYEVLGGAGLPIEFEVPAALPAQHLALPVRRQLYLLYKEALANVLRHAPAACWVRVRLAPEGGGLLLAIDNDAPALAGPARRSGHGLRNIAARATALGGRATCGPLPDGSFGVRVWVPLGG
jgi:signal transduction histidine kinase/tetratricopeptide (TPR) repeat protein